ncbi:MAG: Ku protein [Gemmatimonadota bacterium]|nr:Ku protein [Gemmatimonadota bacterium]
MAARPISSATISLALVNIPIQLYSSAENSQKVRFNFLAPDGARVKQQYVHSKTGDAVARDQMIKGYQFAKDRYVTFTGDELKALEAEATQSIDIVEFVPIDQVERAYIGKTYYLGPDKGGAKAYQLLGVAMKETGRAALAKYAARGKQYLVLIRPVGDHLVMEQLHYANEVRDMSEVPAGEGDVTDAELEMAIQIINSKSAEDFDPSQYEDEVGQRMLSAIEKKINDGALIEASTEEEPATQVIDLMEALRASVGGEGTAEKKKKKKSA